MRDWNRVILWCVFVAALGSCQCQDSPSEPQKQSAPPEKSPDVVFITIDTLRADHLDTYGYERTTSPNLTELARTGVRFERAIAQAPWTLPSLGTLHTSLYPREHGATKQGTVLSDSLTTIAEVASEAGYITIGVVSNVSSNKEHGFGQGFDHWDQTQMQGGRTITAGHLTRIALRLLEESDRSKPFFLWIHYLDPHTYYMPHPRFGYAAQYYAERFPKNGVRAPNKIYDKLESPLREQFVDYARGLYDEEICFNDEKIGVLVDGLKKLDALDDTVFIVTSDHGEFFSEHGRFVHGRDVYEEVIRVPLIVGGAIDPALRGKVVSQRVEISAVPATVMQILGRAKHPFRGPSLLDIASGKESVPVVFTQGLGFKDKDLKDAVYIDEHKLIYNQDYDSYELYDLNDDPKEAHNLIDEPKFAEIRAELKAALDEFRELPRRVGASRVIEYDSRVKEMLKSLGYMD